MKCTNAILSVLTLFILAGSASADAPLPCTTIEGNSGVGITSTAYLANPPEGDNVLGEPTVSLLAVFGREKNLQSFAVTENVLGKYEIGYAYERFGLGDWPDDVKDATGNRVNQHLGLHNLNLRAMVVEEGSNNCIWMPAVTFGTHFKWSEGQTKLDDDLNGTLDNKGSDYSKGVEFTVVATKTIKNLFPRPIIVSAGLRNGDAIHTGLFGFAGNRETTFEGSIISFLTDRLLFCAEYRQKPDLMEQVTAGGEHLVQAENDWWTLCLGYILDDNTTLTAGYVNLGNIGNHKEDGAWCMRINYEF